MREILMIYNNELIRTFIWLQKVKDLADTQDLMNEESDSVPFLTYMLSQNSLTKDEAVSTCVDLLTAATETVSNALNRDNNKNIRKSS